MDKIPSVHALMQMNHYERIAAMPRSTFDLTTLADRLVAHVSEDAIEGVFEIFLAMHDYGAEGARLVCAVGMEKAIARGFSGGLDQAMIKSPAYRRHYQERKRLGLLDALSGASLPPSTEAKDEPTAPWTPTAPATFSRDEHYRRTRELIDYASGQVGKRRALAAELRLLAEDGRLDAGTRARIAAAVAANGP